MPEPRVSVSRHAGYAILTLENERQRNALTMAMLMALDDHIAALVRDSGVRSIIITGAGERAFCAGADVKAWAGLAPFAFAQDWIAPGHRLFDRIAATPKPVIAAINGLALGGGLELLATCDIRIAVRDAALGLPEASIGVVPGWGATQRLSRQMPLAVVKEMALTGKSISAARAYEVGFVNELVDGDPVSRAIELAQQSASLAPRSVEIAKCMINASCGESRGLMVDALAGALAVSTGDKAEGVNAFFEKRPAKFTGN